MSAQRTDRELREPMPPQLVPASHEQMKNASNADLLHDVADVIRRAMMAASVSTTPETTVNENPYRCVVRIIGSATVIVVPKPSFESTLTASASVPTR